eukprot:g1303.t1
MQLAKKQLIALLTAAEKGEKDELAKLIDSHVEFYAKEEDIDLAEDGARDRCRVGVVLSYLDGRKRNALHFAAFSGKTNCVEFLTQLAAKAGDINGYATKLIDTQDLEGSTPLMLAINAGAEEAASMLLVAGANANIATKDGATALHAAAGMGFVQLVKEASSAGCRVDALSDIGTPLHWATGRGHSNTAEALLSLGADPNVLNNAGVPVLVMASARNSLLTVQLLLQSGADLCLTAPNNVSALTVMCDAGNSRLVEVVLANCDEATLKRACAAVDGEGLLPIEVAQWSNHKEIVKMLLPLSPPEASNGLGTLKGVKAAVQAKKDEKDRKAQALKDAADAEASWTPSAQQSKAANEAKLAGNRFFVKKEYKSAIKCYTEGIESHPKHAQLFANRSMCRLALGDAEGALSDAERAKEISPYWNKAYYRVGQCLMALKRYPDAAQVLWNGYSLDTQAKGAKGLQKLFQEAVKLGKRKYQGKKMSKTDAAANATEEEERFDHIIPIEIPVGRFADGNFKTVEFGFNSDVAPAECAGRFVDKHNLDRSLIPMIARKVQEVQKSEA